MFCNGSIAYSIKMPNIKVLIVGASIAGPTAAYWLAKAGAQVTIIERFPELRTNGQNVDIRTSGVTVMRRMGGMEAAVRAKTMPMEGFRFVGADGKAFATMTATGDPERQALVSEYEIFRGELARILFGLTKDNGNVKYVFGEQVVSMQHDNSNNGPVTVEFANGLPKAEFDLVVACDGATSRTRAMGLGCGVRDYTEPLNWWAAHFSIPRDLLQGSNMGESYSAVGGRFAGIGPDKSPGVNQVTFLGIHARNSDPKVMQPFREAQAQKQGENDNTALKEFVARHYTGAGWKCDEIVKHMMHAQDFYASEFVQVKLPSFSKGRFVLVGDAGYAGALGSGTTLALTGAYVLAGEICRHGDDLSAGLKAYEERMHPIVDELQKVPPFITAVLAPQTSWGLWVRNSILAFVSWSGIMEVSQRIFGGAFAAGDKFALPDYEWEL
jgi:2-polyprenyl-6-methoxyphenol hydroxylase-like FAD-dependent oxidoreductase